MTSPKYVTVSVSNKPIKQAFAKTAHEKCPYFTALYLCFWCCQLLDCLTDRNMRINTMTNAYQKSQVKSIVCHAHKNVQSLLQFRCGEQGKDNVSLVHVNDAIGQAL